MKNKSERNSFSVGFISLGCPKNQVDTELMLHKLVDAGYRIETDAGNCDAVIINTCGFISDAKKESIEAILDVASLRVESRKPNIIVTGCMAERYKFEIKESMPETDGVIGLGANGDIVEVVDSVLSGEEVERYPDKSDLPLNGERILTTPSYWAYVKISEGCSNNCAFCAIPKIRGKYRSRRIEDILEEVRSLAASGVKELVLVAQDTSMYGRDIYGEFRLPELLREIAETEGIRWIRFLYCYPERITRELLETMNREPKICKYLDIPLQHADGRILSSMNRPGDRKSFEELIVKIRESVPDISIRTTLMVGFPGETEEQFEELAEFVKNVEFDNMGCFAYSPEEDTAAAKMDNQVDEDVKIHRQELIMELQYGIAVKKNEERLGTVTRVIIDGYSDEYEMYVGRTQWQAPEIDSVTYIEYDGSLSPGDFVTAEIIDYEGYDLVGRIY